MLVTRYNPYTQIREFRKSFDLLNTMLDDIEQTKGSSSKDDFLPTINTREGKYAFHIEVDLPGIKKDDVDIKIDDSTLVVSGERKVKNEIKEGEYYKIESSFGKFSRSFSIPEEVDVENIHAESKDGVLEIILPKLEDVKTDKIKKIEIN